MRGQSGAGPQHISNNGRRPQGSPPIILSSPASTMTMASGARAFIVEAGVDAGKGGDPCGRLPWFYFSGLLPLFSDLKWIGACPALASLRIRDWLRLDWLNIIYKGPRLLLVNNLILEDAPQDGDRVGVGGVHAKVGEAARAQVFAACVGGI